ncbi:MAG: hypothetical protein GY940_09740 [bacterium]|nr:hypothetical protein [bacterium]
MMKYVLPVTMLILFLSFSPGTSKPEPDSPPSYHPSAQFNNYWYAGKAELTNYKLKQARYGEVHDGNAVLIYVTEDFSKQHQVKIDDPSKHKNDLVKVLKCNKVKKFLTGLYPYSMMLSAFTPVSTQAYPGTLKTTMSSQEWCGHAFTQMNAMNGDGDGNGDDHGGYSVKSYSYFDSERDMAYTLNNTPLEDDTWNRIRIDPQSLPVGEIKMVPGLMACRFLHIKPVAREVRASLKESVKEGISAYRLEYPKLDRTLTIYFENTFPHAITGWEETFISGWGAGAKRLTTTAVREKTALLDYWRLNRANDRPKRELLGLPVQ